ncbi:MAG: hypothetical protein ABIQ44_06815, partial [Chloroflexia bacterium]
MGRGETKKSTWYAQGVFVQYSRVFARFLTALALVVVPAVAQPKAIQILDEELNRNFAALKKSDPAPYYLSYQLVEQESTAVTATLGTLQGTSGGKSRTLDVSVRVGDAKLDNYRQIRGDRPQFSGAISMPLEDEPNAMKRRLWLETDRVYRLGAQRLINIKTNQQVKLEGDDKSGDFSEAPPVVKFVDVAPLKFDKKVWEERARKWSQYFADKPEVLSSSVV